MISSLYIFVINPKMHKFTLKIIVKYWHYLWPTYVCID